MYAYHVHVDLPLKCTANRLSLLCFLLLWPAVDGCSWCVADGIAVRRLYRAYPKPWTSQLPDADFQASACLSLDEIPILSTCAYPARLLSCPASLSRSTPLNLYKPAYIPSHTKQRQALLSLHLVHVGMSLWFKYTQWSVWPVSRAQYAGQSLYLPHGIWIDLHVSIAAHLHKRHAHAICRHAALTTKMPWLQRVGLSLARLQLPLLAHCALAASCVNASTARQHSQSSPCWHSLSSAIRTRCTLTVNWLPSSSIRPSICKQACVLIPSW